MSLKDSLNSIEGAATVDELKSTLHSIVQTYGFASFAFVEMTHSGNATPLWMSTSSSAWLDDYQGYGFVEFDPVIQAARRTNRVFSWSDVPLAPRRGKRKPAAHRIMEAARDHGLTEGLCIPFHYVDPIGRIRSASCVLYWTEKPLFFQRIPLQARSELHVVMIYWMQRIIELVDRATKKNKSHSFVSVDEQTMSLTDRERQVLEWAARGKTVAESAVILDISADTIETHIRSAMRRLGVVNKTQAAVKAFQIGLIDV